MKMIIGLFILLLLVVGAIAFSQQYLKNGAFPFGKQPTATVKGHTFTLLEAKTVEETQKGLSDRSSLDKSTGMLFVFEKADAYPFWMKNMKFPLDIIYIKGDKIIDVFQDVPVPAQNDTNPPIIRPHEAADKVLEINAGLTKDYSIGTGDTITFKDL